MTAPAKHEIRDDLAYDVGNGIGWALGSAMVALARPVAWLIFHDWNDQREQWQRWRERMRR